MTTRDGEDIVNAVNNGNLAEQCEALEEYRKNATSFGDIDRISIGRAAMNALAHSAGRYCLTEKHVLSYRIAGLGEEIIPPAIDVLSRSNDPEVRLFASTLLLEKGDYTGVPVLLSEVREGSEGRYIAARALVNAGIKDVAPRIREILSRRPPLSDNQLPMNEDCWTMQFMELLVQIEGVPVNEILWR